MLHDISKKWKVGPFSAKPFEFFFGSPMGAFSKEVVDKLSNKTQKIRVIHDLSWPPEHSVNSFIAPDVSSVQYINLDVAIRMVKNAGQNCLMAKTDLRDAYKQIGVHPEDWLGTTWINDSGTTEYFYDTVLPFGCRSSAALFDKFATGLEFIIFQNGVTQMFRLCDCDVKYM
jgi:hypothetical protein